MHHHHHHHHRPPTTDLYFFNFFFLVEWETFLDRILAFDPPVKECSLACVSSRRFLASRSIICCQCRFECLNYELHNSTPSRRKDPTRRMSWLAKKRGQWKWKRRECALCPLPARRPHRPPPAAPAAPALPPQVRAPPLSLRTASLRRTSADFSALVFN